LPSEVLLVPSFINKTVMVLLLCLIFIGQSMASMTMLYDMTAMQVSTQSMTNMSSMESAHHDMSDMADCDDDMMTTSTMTCSSTTTEDCCAQECDCLTSGCSTASAFSAIMHYSPDIAISSKITSITTIVTSQALTSLYRPPILS
jgi:hypothetical protein